MPWASATPSSSAFGGSRVALTWTDADDGATAWLVMKPLDCTDPWTEPQEAANETRSDIAARRMGRF